jgi:hypothetical protein
MLKWKTWSVAALGVTLLMPGTETRAQQAGSSAASNATVLMAMDDIEIQQLVARHAYAIDTHADNGYAYADLFAPDGTFGWRFKSRTYIVSKIGRRRA